MPAPYPLIVCTEPVLWGQPRLDGRRLAVGDVVSSVHYSENLREVQEEYDLSTEQIRQALMYCSSLQCQFDKPMRFCHNCSLRPQDHLDLSEVGEIEMDGNTFVKDGDGWFLGNLEEYLKARQGEAWWEIATDQLIEKRKELGL